MRVANAQGVVTHYKRATALPITPVAIGQTRDSRTHPTRDYRGLPESYLHRYTHTFRLPLSTIEY